MADDGGRHAGRTSRIFGHGLIGRANRNLPDRSFMKVAIFSTNVAGIYSGGRYLSLIMGYSLARVGVEVDYYTNLVPTFNGDFEDLPEAQRVSVIASDTWPSHGDPSVDWVIVIPTGGVADEFYAAARNFARLSDAQIALLSFETSNWFNALLENGKSPLPWEGWASVVSDGGAVITIAKEGQFFAEPYYANLHPDAPIVYDYWHPAINDFAVEKIDWENVPVYPNRITCFVRVSDDHKGSAELLSFPDEFFRYKTLCLVFGRGINNDFVAALRAKTANAIGCSILAFDRVTDEEKLALLASSTALLFPSRFEGFGYPPVEAAYVGTPTIAYDLPVVRETIGSMGSFVAVDDTDRLAAMTHETAAEWSAVPQRINIPARCTLEQAGMSLLNTLKRAGEKLASLDQTPAARNLPDETTWRTAPEAWGWFDVTYRMGNRAAFKAVVKTRNTSSDVTLRLNGALISEAFAQIDHAYPGFIAIEGVIPLGLMDDHETMVLCVYQNQVLVSKILPTIHVEPEAHLLRRSITHSSPDFDGQDRVRISIADEEFGREFTSRFALSCLVSELRICDFKCALSAPKQVLERLVDQPMFAGLFDQVERSSIVEEWRGAKVIALCEGIKDNPHLIQASSCDTGGASANVQLAINTAANILANENRALVALQSAIDQTPAKFQTIFLLNAIERGELKHAARQIILALNHVYGDETPEIACVCREIELEDPSLQDSTSFSCVNEQEYILTTQRTACVTVDILDAGSSATKNARESEIFYDGSDDPIKTAKFIQERLMLSAAGPSLELTVPALLDDSFDLQTPSANNLSQKMSVLRRDRQLASRWKRPTGLQLTPHMRKPPLIERESLATVTSGAPALCDLAVNARHRVSGDRLEFCARTGGEFEFLVRKEASSIQAEIMCMVKSTSAKKVNLNLRLNEGSQHTKKLAANQWHRVQFGGEIDMDDVAGEHVRIQIGIDKFDGEEIIAVRALGLLVGAADAGSALVDTPASSDPTIANAFDAVPRVKIDRRQPIEIVMNSAASIVAVGRGWGKRETSYRWTLGNVSEFYVPDLASENALELSVSAGAFLAPGEQNKTLTVQINGQQIGELVFSSTPEKKSLEIPARISAAGFSRIDFLINDPKSPLSLGISGDSRKLGFCFYKIELQERDE